MPPASRRSTGGCPKSTRRCAPDDFCVITADHGNDPTWRGFDHTREHVPILAFGAGRRAAGPIGARASLADIAETIAAKLGLPPGRTARAGRRELRARRAARGGYDRRSAICGSSRVLLMNDARCPWLILVPRREGVVESTDLDAGDRALLIEEVARRAARFLKAHTGVAQDQCRRARQCRAPAACPCRRAQRRRSRLARAGLGHGAATPYREAEAEALIAAARSGFGI